ncbi:MAG: S-layer homology domain-containing protein, partial [Cyanobacteria bacterium]|nr:S-layer homology domain-containing protein [Cyanobacteriota bacterium]MDW8203045.1 S-layer homology domain-containing protein [Cyanobacteriota bacterium SKYGB_h_bin112]
RSRNAIRFVDVPSTYWAYSVVQTAYTTEFLSGYPGNVFLPEQNIPRVQALVSLASGLGYTPSGNPNLILPQFYNDAADIPSYAYSGITAATQRQIVVNYPNIRQLNPNQIATRADVAAFIYQALVQSGQAVRINSSYIVGQAPTTPQLSQNRIVAGTLIPVSYDKSKILLAPNETVPLTLRVRQAVAAPAGNVLIPVGTQVVGELRPAQNGSQFVARELVFVDGRRMTINATSQIISRTEEISQGINVGNVLRNAALGGAAAAAIAAVTGDTAIATEEVLSGVGVGLLAGLLLERNRVTLISVNPEADLTLTVNSDLVMQF